jgi:N-methylhydantoinase A
MLAEVMDALAPGVPYSLSSDVLPEIREYERTATTVADAYVKPLLARYIERMRDGLRELDVSGELFLMLSSGGIGAWQTGVAFPIRLVESGPAAGAVAAALSGELTDTRHVLAFDMGGTTAKACLIEDGVPAVTSEFEVDRVYQHKKGSGLPVRIPVIEMIEIGAGGGSLAWIDSLGLLKVGPQSAGASPGPMCYGRGGTQPTVTDANVLLGYVNPAFFLGGRMPLDRDSAERGLAELGATLGLDCIEVAKGIAEIVNENMASMVRVHAAERGRDLGAFSLVAFGGSGPVHSYEVAKKLGLKRIIWPPAAGVASAVGLLVAAPAFDVVRSHLAHVSRLDWPRVNAVFRDMEAQAARLLHVAGVAEEAVEFERGGDFRYVGQGYEVTVALPRAELRAEDGARVIAAFETEYRRQFQREIGGGEVEVVNVRVRACGPKPTVSLSPGTLGEGRGAVKGLRAVYFAEVAGFVECPVYDRYQLTPGMHLAGPAIVEEVESTGVVGPGGEVEVDAHLNLVVTLGETARSGSGRHSQAGSRVRVAAE